MQLQSSKKQIIFTSLLCFSAIAFPVASQAITVQEVPNPRQVNNTWVTDKANILSDSTETQLNQMIAELEAKNGSEIAVVTVPDTKPSATPKAFATELFNFWGIGKKNTNNGVLLLISSGERRVQIETGSGIQSILPDARVVSIIQTEITPRFKQQDFDGGTLAGTKALVNVLQTPIANVEYQTALPLAPIVPRQGVQPSATQSQNTPLVPPTVQSLGVIPSPIPAQSPVVVHDNSPVGWLIFLLILALPVLLIGWIIRSIISSLRSSPNSSSRNHNNRRHNYDSSGSTDYSSGSSDYSSSSSDSGGSFGGGDSGGGGGGGDY
ncbi:TPM domain-containing protein [Microcoleus sp. LEGE 07076]|uniref:TPM domain-containing protein n=1 Tax=Microcoleus sp. LEGE 07076 TaxID=915322 RepID=UPI00187F3645|nr:TPM domain-containing protein [Microcoleus sp. LEGE 07076]MBE9183331.1 TPM domain-containing protein [Microcoleus sp. LEGE 07076]